MSTPFSLHAIPIYKSLRII